MRFLFDALFILQAIFFLSLLSHQFTCLVVVHVVIGCGLLKVKFRGIMCACGTWVVFLASSRILLQTGQLGGYAATTIYYCVQTRAVL